MCSCIVLFICAISHACDILPLFCCTCANLQQKNAPVVDTGALVRGKDTRSHLLMSLFYHSFFWFYTTASLHKTVIFFL